MSRRTVQRVEGVAEGSGQQDEKEAQPKADPAAEQDQKRRAEQDIAEQVLAVGVQRQRGNAAVPLVKELYTEDIQRAEPRPFLRWQIRQAGKMRQKSPMHPDAVPENEQEQQRHHPMCVVVRGRFDVDRARPAAFGLYGFQFGTGLALEQGGDVQTKLVSPPCKQIRDVS